jgi:hypothetical protein
MGWWIPQEKNISENESTNHQPSFPPQATIIMPSKASLGCVGAFGLLVSF